MAQITAGMHAKYALCTATPSTGASRPHLCLGKARCTSVLLLDMGALDVPVGVEHGRAWKAAFGEIWPFRTVSRLVALSLRPSILTRLAANVCGCCRKPRVSISRAGERSVLVPRLKTCAYLVRMRIDILNSIYT